MTKIVDDNGFWLIEHNPISKEGVFPYLGKTISSELEPDKIYMVYRPASELADAETIKSFNAVPFSDEHEMLGEGFTPYDKKPASGVLFNTYTEDGEMYGDLKIFSESLKDEIANGKKELSLGYLCEYEIKRGVWNGQPYDAIQHNLRGNHIALVDKGRMGSDVRVYDKAITMDALDIVIDQAIPSGDGSPEQSREDNSSKTEIGELQMDKTYSKSAVIAALKACSLDEDDIEKVEDELEKTEDESEKEEEKKAEDECSSKPSEDEEESKEDKKAEDESEEEKKDTEDEDEEKKDTEDEDDDEKKAEDEDDEDDKKSAEDSAKAVLKELDARASLKKSLEPHIGAFACDGMTAKEIAEYGCKKLGLQATADEAQAVLRGFFAAHSKDNKVFGLDSAPAKAVGMDKSIQKYLND